LPALFQKTVAAQLTNDAPVNEALKLDLVHAANDRGAHTTIQVKSGPAGFNREALQEALKAKNLRDLLNVLPKLGEDATLDGVMSLQTQKDFEMRPSIWMLEADFDASMNMPTSPPAWSFSGKASDPKTQTALEQVKSALGQEIKAEVDDFVSYGANRRP
jgi:hypothetical protein